MHTPIHFGLPYIQGVFLAEGIIGQGPGPEWVGLGPAVVCGFLNLCRKHFTAWVQVDYEDLFIKAGGSETRKGLA